jgi:signal transduction histidine kinase/CheY-like chemotaxis protein
MVVVSYYFVSGIVEKQLFANAQETLNTAEVTIRSDLREAEIALLQAEVMINNWLKWGESVEVVKSYMTLLADTMKFDNTRINGFLNVYGLVNDSYITGLYGIPPGDYIPEDRPWYKTGEAAKGRIGISLPYTDWETGELVISIVKIIHDETGKSFGMMAIDVDFSILASYIESINSAKGGFGLLCNEDFVVMAHPSRDWLNRNMEDISSGHARNVMELKKNPDSVQTNRILNSYGVPAILISKQIYNGWYLGIVTPVKSYFRDVNSMALILSALGIVFMVMLCFVLIRLSISKARSDEENLGKTSFLARMSHEIRTPMNSILGMAELIRRKTVPGEIREYIEIINQSGNSLLAIINDILDFSKIESGRLEIQNRDYDIASVINDIINIMRPKIAEKSLDFLVNLDSAIPAMLFGDDIRLRQILMNLLSNAMKYTRKGFISLEIGMERLDSGALKLICSVKDSGIGIKPEDRERLFTEFSRMDTKANREVEGTGLGLVITRALCRAMGGDIMVLSEYGKGSNFWVEITQKFENEEPVVQVSNLEEKRVLFYDSRPQYIQSIKRTFKNLGVDFECSPTFQDFIVGLEHGEFEYAFVSSKYAMDCIGISGNRQRPLSLVIMVEPGEISVYREITSVSMPVYSIPVANVLNDMSGEILFHDKKFKIEFTAPSAKILIVDDINTNLRVARELMAPYGMNIHTCLSGSEALNLVKNNSYDIVFMDHMMPEMDGIETTALIRNLESRDDRYKKLPVVALTANAVSGQREMFLEHGINDFLAKPIEIKKLDDILVKWLPLEKRVESDQPYTEDTQQGKDENILIHGVDTALGLRNCGGNVPVYFNILTDFCNDAEVKLVQISYKLACEDTRLYETLVHALKGAARSIGALETGEKASLLEKAAARKDLAAIKNKTPDLAEDVQALIMNIKSAAGRYESKGSRNPENISILKLDKLKTALTEMDIEAVNRMLVTFAGLSLDGKTKELVSEIEQHILMFDYEKAIEKIDKLF